MLIALMVATQVVRSKSKALNAQRTTINNCKLELIKEQSLSASNSNHYQHQEITNNDKQLNHQNKNSEDTNIVLNVGNKLIKDDQVLKMKSKNKVRLPAMREKKSNVDELQNKECNNENKNCDYNALTASSSLATSTSHNKRSFFHKLAARCWPLRWTNNAKQLQNKQLQSASLPCSPVKQPASHSPLDNNDDDEIAEARSSSTLQLRRASDFDTRPPQDSFNTPLEVEEQQQQHQVHNKCKRDKQSARPSVRFIDTTATTTTTTKSSTNKIKEEEEEEEEKSTVDATTNNLMIQNNESNNNNNSQQTDCPMSSAQFRTHGYQLIDFIANYLDTIDKQRVTPVNVEPGYLQALIDESAPVCGEPFSKIMRDFDNYIMRGITHWQHPHFHAYFPAGDSFPSILANLLSDALGCVGFSWAASPAMTELEIIMLDWIGKMIGLPSEFLCLSGESSNSRGGGAIQGSASECVLVNMLAARHWAMEKLRVKHPEIADGVLLSRLVGYCSREAHSCVEKAAMIAFVRMRALETDEQNSLRGATLLEAIKEDLTNGLQPFYVSATLGTTSCCSFDNINELGIICEQFDVWLHVDGAYAGNALICPEFKYLSAGIERATSFNMNPNKWMLMNFDCSLMWVKDRFKLTRAFVVDPLYLQHSFSDQAIDYRHWGIPLSRRFRSLKLWFVIRNYGVEGLQAYIRNHVKLAKLFESLIKSDSRFVITNQVVLGLVCFRLIGSNALNQRLLTMINASGKLHMVPASLNNRYIIRFCVCAQNANEQDIHYAYNCVSSFASELFEAIRVGKERVRAISQQNTIDISSLALHTQQSLSVDRPSSANVTNTNAQATTAVKQQQQQQATSRRQFRMQRNSKHGTTLADCGSLSKTNEWAMPASLSSVNERVKSPLCKQNSTMLNNSDNALATTEINLLSQQNMSSSGNNGRENITENVNAKNLLFNNTDINNSNNNEDNNDDDDDDLDAEVSLADSLNKLDDDEHLFFDDIDDENNNNNDSDDVNQCCNGIKPQSATSRQSTISDLSNCQQQDATQSPSVGDEATDELQALNRRNKMSLRNKRKFFVHTTSDPRVYRVSISGDINAHKNSSSSSASLGLTSQQQQQQQQQNQQQQQQTNCNSNC